MSEETGYTKKGIDWLGKPIDEHFDSKGNKVGETRDGIGWTGKPTKEHFDTSSNKTGQTKGGIGWTGKPINEHFDTSGKKTGETRSGTDWIGDPIKEHFDAGGQKTGETRGGIDWAGRPMKVHSGNPSQTTEAPQQRGNKRSSGGSAAGPKEANSHNAPDESTSGVQQNASESLAHYTRRWPKWFLIFLAFGAIYHGGKYLSTSTAPPASSTSTRSQLLASPAPPIPTVAPSFDCTKATWKSERMVCSSRQLSVLDLALSNAYRDAVARSPARAAELRTSQNHWIRKNRENCGDIACLQQVYEARTLYLSKF